jgi:hypothetical protein
VSHPGTDHDTHMSTLKAPLKRLENQTQTRKLASSTSSSGDMGGQTRGGVWGGGGITGGGPAPHILPSAWRAYEANTLFDKICFMICLIV